MWTRPRPRCGKPRARLAGNADAADSYAEAALTGLRDRSDLLDTAAQRTVEELMTASWRHGWLPEDLLQTAQRNAGAAEASYLVDQVAAEHRHYPPARIHPRWHRQLVDLGATRWWDTARPHLPQWARRRGIDLAAAVHAVIGTIALLRSLPELPRVLPLPGTAPVSDAATARAVDPKVLARVRGLLAKAESTEFGEEAEALSAKAQELMTRHALERVVEELFDSMFPALVHRSCSVSNAEGWHAGRVAADLAILDSHRSLSTG